ncbi:MAG: aldehyde dehydrogenase family protein [Solirubrobacteraceae bacterium]|nr:aldehyde dehydrogenase family protein [Patulibacter sp.]
MSHATLTDLRRHQQFYIGGAWVDPSGSGLVKVVSPATAGEQIATVPEATTADADAAVAAAREAFDKGPWATLTPLERAAHVTRIVEELEARRDELVEIQSAEMGMPTMVSNGHFDMALTTARVFVEAADKVVVEETRTHIGGTAIVRTEPVGVLLGIVPWNAPLVLGILKLGAALVAGCTVVLRPAIEAPLVPQLLAEAIEAAGLPDGVVNILPADREVSEYLVKHPGIDKVSFTGSTPVGKEIMRLCADRVAGVTLELGGKSAMIVLDDADVDVVAQNVIGAACFGTGQVCSALTRVVVAKSLEEKLTAAISKAMSETTVGDPFAEGVMVGPLATAAQHARVTKFIEVGKSEGATVAHGGGVPEGLGGWYIEPTLFTGVTTKMTIAQEEIFGPVVSMITFETEDEAVEIANDSRFGLHGAVFTADSDRGVAIARKIRAGTFGVNHVLPSTLFPYSGWKESGLGIEGDIEGILDCMHTKQIIVGEV